MKFKRKKQRGRKRKKLSFKKQVAGYLVIVCLVAIGMSTRYVMTKDSVKDKGVMASHLLD